MNDTYYETEAFQLERSTKQKEKSKRQTNKKLTYAVAVSVWLLLAVGAFALAYYFVGDIRNQLVAIQQTNDANIAELQTKLTELQNVLNRNVEHAGALKQQIEIVVGELVVVKEQMSLAGDSLSTTAESKQALNERITELSKELEELRKSIKKLEEAARVY